MSRWQSVKKLSRWNVIAILAALLQSGHYFGLCKGSEVSGRYPVGECLFLLGGQVNVICRR